MRLLTALVLVAVGCGGDPPLAPDAPLDAASPVDASVTTEQCAYEPVPATAGAGGTVEAGALRAGAAEQILPVPVGTALGGYTGRASFFGGGSPVDSREVAISGSFAPSIGVTAAPRVKVLALAAGGETVVIVKLDVIFVYEGMVAELEARLGPAFAGKVLVAASHSHSAWAQHTGHGPLQLGAGRHRELVSARMLDAMVATAETALARLEPARLGVHTSQTFDAEDAINRDRRSVNDALPGGNRGDDHLALLRVDRADGSPIAIVPIFGEHPTLNGEDNALASSDATGALERLWQEQFDAPVVVMHLQSAGGDSTAVGHGGIDCATRPVPAEPCFEWTSEEGHARAALPTLQAAWEAAGAAMLESLELEMVTRSIELGPDPATFAIRGGALAYAPWDGVTPADGVVSTDGALRSPIDEFNAPVGAALCEGPSAMFPPAMIPGTDGIVPYGSCLRFDEAAPLIEDLFDIAVAVDATHPVCETTRTTISALHLGPLVLATLPGEVTILIADLVRERTGSTATAPVIPLGYAQGHVGYLLRPEDWVLGGYEPSVTFWGPLEAESIVERLAELVPLARSPAREDATVGGTTRVVPLHPDDDLERDDPAPDAGTVPAAVPAETWARTGTPVVAEPAPVIPRVAGLATFTFIGDDPLVRTPRVILEREVGAGFEPARRRSGAVVEDGELVVAYTPVPLQRMPGVAQTHVWTVEWQAVPWVGMPDHDGLAERANLPLGRYRFAVTGDGWTLTSTAFEVVSGGTRVDSVARGGGSITGRLALHAPLGWRLLDLALPSNQPVPVRTQPITVELVDASGTVVATRSGSTDAAGAFSVADATAATDIHVIDRHGNAARAALP